MRRRTTVGLAVLVGLAVAGGGAWMGGVGPFPERVDGATAERARADWRELIAELDEDVPGRACLEAFAEEADPPIRGYAPALGGPVRAVRGQVEGLREREFEQQVEVELIDPATFEERVDGGLDRWDDERDQLVLRAMDAIPREGVLTELGEEQRGFFGIYLFEGSVLVASQHPDEPDAEDRAVMAHELGHALSDQTIGLPRTDLWPYSQDPDLRDVAIAISEGDASLLHLRYWLHHVPVDQQLAAPEMLDRYTVDPGSPVFHLEQAQRLPYRLGLDRACDAWLEGGWDAVDALYEEHSETMHGMLYGPDQPRIEPPEPEAPDGLTSLDDEPFGVGPLLTALQAPGDDPGQGFDDALERAQAWAGGQSWVWRDDNDPDRSVVAIVLTDGGAGSAPLCDTVKLWRTAAAPNAEESTHELGLVRRNEGRTELIRCEDDIVWFVVGPDLETLGTVATDP